MMKNPNILTVGTTSGIGQYIHRELDGCAITRATPREEIEELRERGVDVIIHCARNKDKFVSSENLYQYTKDNVFLTRQLIEIPHKKFIYFSSVEVYPKNSREHFENEIIDVDSLNTVYSLTKLMSEAIILDNCKNLLLIRAAVLLGREMRKNSFRQILEEKKCALTLSPESVFNYVLYSDILEFIKHSIKYDLCGIYNASCSENISLSDASKIMCAEPNFGTYIYDVGTINNTKIAELIPHFRRSSKENIELFLKDIG